ncbi:prolyl oligopeptidase family serine peptidase [uncultured Tateyamaria sp.]|uniref:alpha/beta hydrolase family esterase n=1 Tax=uncultured Tateyamaria sp. TaxID=455651 RepID=UPI00262D3580|nr:prolyl oligopeptidase family serine peptidase [uncultured Tateyamaria sp.]
MTSRMFATALLFCASFGAAPAMACGPDTDCTIGDRFYRIAMPDGADAAQPVGAIVFAHGYRGTARGTMRNMNLRRMVSDMGLALIAVKSAGPDWNIPGVPSNVDSTGTEEMAYFDAVIADATDRFAIDPDRIMMSGFSAGGMVTWELACHRPDLFAGFAPVAGTFWQGPPETCETPASVVHIHGTQDSTVPLAGRRIAQTKQGDVMQVLDMYQSHGAFAPQSSANAGDLSCARQSNPQGDILEFCTFEGGHSFRRSFLSYAWDRMVAAGQV